MKLFCVAGAALLFFGVCGAGPAPAGPEVSPAGLGGFVREVGFPAAAFVLMWAMVRGALRDLAAALLELSGEIRELRGHCRRMEGGGKGA